MLVDERAMAGLATIAATTSIASTPATRARSEHVVATNTAATTVAPTAAATATTTSARPVGAVAATNGAVAAAAAASASVSRTCDQHRQNNDV